MVAHVMKFSHIPAIPMNDKDEWKNYLALFYLLICKKDNDIKQFLEQIIDDDSLEACVNRCMFMMQEVNN